MNLVFGLDYGGVGIKIEVICGSHGKETGCSDFSFLRYSWIYGGSNKCYRFELDHHF